MTIPRLLYGYLSQSTDAYNLTIPWRDSAQDGLFQMNYSLQEAVETNLRAWAKTNRGDRPMRFDFGLDAYRVLFEPNPIAKEILLNRARDQMQKYFGFIKIKRLEVLTNDDSEDVLPNSVRFVLEGTFKDNEDKKIKVSEDIGL